MPVVSATGSVRMGQEVAKVLSQRLARGILEVVEDPELAARLAANGDETARFYSWESAAQRHAELYGSILEERSEGKIKRAGSHA